MLRELFALALIFIGLFLLLALFSFDPRDPGFNHIVSAKEKINNWTGVVGAYLSGFIVDLFGLGSFAFPLVLFSIGKMLFNPETSIPWWRWIGIALLILCVSAWGASDWSINNFSIGYVATGGLLGGLLYVTAEYLLRPTGALLLWLLCLFACLPMLTGMSWGLFLKKMRNRLTDLYMKYQERLSRRQRESIKRYANPSVSEQPSSTTDLLKDSRIFGKRDKIAEEKTDDPSANAASNEQSDSLLSILTKGPPDERNTGGQMPTIMPAQEQKAAKQVHDLHNPSLSLPEFLKGNSEQEYHPPALDLANNQDYSGNEAESGLVTPEPKPPKTVKTKIPPLPRADIMPEVTHSLKMPSAEELSVRAQAIRDCLAEFGVQGEVSRVTPGPVVTMFEYRPGPGVKVSKIAGLSDDLAMAMRAISVRVEAPIPGTNTVGIELPNEDRQTVFFRDIIESEAFKKSSSCLPLALGKGIAGHPKVVDLAAMPHLLVAGATGSGKSVCINSILLSLLFKARPDQVKLLLIDPKRIELSIYADLPHLIHPVVTEMADAKNALEWAVWEMERRYEAMQRIKAIHIESYNLILNELGQECPESMEDLLPMPRLVIIIDELADLMLTAGKEAELSIVRLAQLARASGIHLILATQRPSVDVVTGLIKANFPSRISFQVTSKHDSRTILDTVGAEHLLGKGDMLYKSGGGGLQRLHGAFIDNKDVLAVVKFWKEQQPPVYELDLSDWKNGDRQAALPGTDGEGLDDPMYQEVVDFVLSQGKASISLLQRRFRIGFNRAARYIEQMEKDGIIGPADGSKPRMVHGARE